jgi:hypothetical protein
MPSLTNVRRLWPPAVLVLLALVLLALVLLALVAGYFEPWAMRGPFWEKYKAVQFDMTEAEVKALLGPPMLEEYPGGSLGDSCYAWFDGRQTIAVDFDVSGKMTEKRFRVGRSEWWIRGRAKQLP